LTVDFSHYKANTLHRRISRRMALHRIEALKDYVGYLMAHPQELVALFDDFLINVTSFFRNPEAFEVLKQQVFPRLLAGRTTDNPVRIWVVGCSTGEEAYSIAMTLIEYMEQARILLPVQILASDLNGKGIETARAGIYSQSIAEHVSPERLRRFFHGQDGRYQVNKVIREMCLFARHNALTDPPFSRLDLVSCRNMLIYLEPVMQKRLLPLLHYGLKPGGVLWLGVSETIGGFRDLFEPEDVKHKMYTRKATTRVTDLPIPLLDRPAPSEQPSKSASLEQLGFPPPDAQRDADRILLHRYSPPGVLVNHDLEILQFRGNTSPFLTPAAGKASLHLMRMLREGLAVPVRAALAAAKKENVTVRKDGMPVLVDGKRTPVNVEVIPVKGNKAGEDCFLVLFQAVTSGSGARAQREGRNRAAEDEASHEATRLRQELTTSREYLQSVIEQQEASYEELQSANEEVQSANEELQSINEELETAQEETQSANEELGTVNEELNTRNAELAETNNDLLNLLGSVQMSIIMLDRELRIRRFTPTAERMVNLLAADVGRPIGDINLNLDLPDLEAVVTDVIASVTPVQREVRDRAGHWYSVRVRPYMTRDNRIDGAVLVLVDIDSLKTTEESLRASEERYRIMYERAPLGIFETDLDGRFVRVNDEFCRMTGRGRESLLTRRSRDITHPDDLAADIEAFRLLRSGEATSFQLQKRYLLNDGKPLWVEIHRFVITGPDGAPRFTVGVVEDIQERKSNEDALKESEARFRLLADSAPVLIWVNGLSGIEFVNRAHLDFLGAALAQVKGMGWTRFIHPADREQYLASYEDAMRRGERFEGQCRLRRHDGEYRSMLSVAIPRYEGEERVVGYVGCMVDVTEIKQAEESLRVADLKKNQFIALLAYELRIPLAPLRNVATLLNSPGLEPRTLTWAHDVLNRQLRNITRMVDDLLDVSRITEEKIQLEREPIVLADVIERSIEAVRSQLQAGAKHLDVRLPHTPVYLDADPVRLEQLFSNLLGNAIKFTHHAGHIWVTAKLQSDRPQMVETRIRDDGMGISSELLPRIFDLFIQADTSLERTHGGLGIGLTLVKRMVELHGGTIEARSDGPGHGAEFIVRFPFWVSYLLS
jgi:two-component system CheB/CheR fusion protein